LSIFGIATKYLKEYISTERDYLRKIVRMPGIEFRCWEEDISEDEYNQEHL
jgi:hypothetical protein